MKTLAEELQAEEELLRRRFIHMTRVKGRMLTMDEARAVCEEMEKSRPAASRDGS